MVMELPPRRRRRVAPPSDTPVVATYVASPPSSDQPETATTADMRPAMHPEMRGETSIERANRLTQEIFEHEKDLGDTEDKFPMPAGGPPDGFMYEWKRHTVYGATNPAYTVALATAGWRPVPASRHPEFMPLGGAYETIEREGLILMELPKQVHSHREQRNLRRAREQVEIKQAQLSRPAGPGQFERNNKGLSMVDIKRGYEPLTIPSSTSKV